MSFGGVERLNNFSFKKNKKSLDKIWTPNLYSKRYILQEKFFEKLTKEYILQQYSKLIDPDYGATRNVENKIDFSSKNITINQEDIKILENSVGKKVMFIIMPIFNTTYNITSLKIKDNIIDLTRLNISQEDYLDSTHFREHGAEIIAETLCKKVKF